MLQTVVSPKQQAHRLQGRMYRARKAGRLQLVQQLEKELNQINYTGIRPEIAGSMIGHCGQWHCVQRELPTTVPCCGVLLLMYCQ